jgi:hypothetical protein
VLGVGVKSSTSNLLISSASRTRFRPSRTCPRNSRTSSVSCSTRSRRSSARTTT